MGDVVAHPAKKQRMDEVKFKLVDAIAGLGIEDEFRELPDEEKLKLWRRAYVYEIEVPGAGLDLLKGYFDDGKE